MSDIVLGTCGRLGAPAPKAHQAEDAAALAERIRRLEKVNAALIARAERITESQADAYSLFQAAIMLENQVQKRTEELLAAKRRLERSNREISEAKEAADIANRSKSRFLTAAGHDLLQPLNAARLLIQAVAETPSSADPDAIGALLGQVDRALATIGDLIKSVLDIAKLEAGVMVPKIDVFSLRALLAEVAAAFAPMAAQKHLRLSVIAPELSICSDPILLKRILANLTSNALRYTRTGGVLLGARQRGGSVRLQVVDTGVGIAPEHSAAIFEEFHRGPAQGTDASAAEGLGLGLAIVRRMAQALDHELSFRSSVGRGSVFSILVPIALAPAPGSAGLPNLSTHADRLAEARLLLIENDAQIVDAMRALMARWQCAMAVASDIESAVARIDDMHDAPNLIIADYHLDNGLCGLEVVAAVREKMGRALPAIIATADHTPAVEAEVKAQGLTLLKKPLKPAELRALITHVLS